MRRIVLSTVAIAATTLQCSHAPNRLPGDPKLRLAGETRLLDIRQLTHGGVNSRPFWSADGSLLGFQHRGPLEGASGPACEEIYVIKPEGAGLRMISAGKGTAGSGAFLAPGNERVVFSSPLSASGACPAALTPDGDGEVTLDPTLQFYTSKVDGTDLLPFEPAEPRAYNAEPASCPANRKDGGVFFSSDRDGDPELFQGSVDRFGTLKDVTRITRAVGYDGGVAVSRDCQRIAWSANRPRGEKQLSAYRELLKQHRADLDRTEIWVADATGHGARQLTNLGATSLSPTFLPDGNRILFSSNARDPEEGRFDLYLIRVDGTGLEQVTFSEGFDGFPAIWSDDQGNTSLAFTSSRGAATPGEVNLFISGWDDQAAGSPSAAKDLSEAANRFKTVADHLAALPKVGTGIAPAESFIAEQFAAMGLTPFFKEGFTQKIDLLLGGSGSGAEKRLAVAHTVAGTWGQSCARKRPVIVSAHLNVSGADHDLSGIAALLETVRGIQAAGPQAAKGCYLFAVFPLEGSAVTAVSRMMMSLQEFRIRPKGLLGIHEAGGLEENRIRVLGTDSAPEWPLWLNPHCDKEGLECVASAEGLQSYEPTESRAFYSAKIPALDFMSGPARDSINATGGVQTARLVAAAAIRASTARQLLHYRKDAVFAAPQVAPAPRAEGEGPTAAASAVPSPAPSPESGYLGTIPDYGYASVTHSQADGAELEAGVRFASARPGSPASKAGVKSGDILKSIEMPAGADGKRPTWKVRSIEDYMGALQSLKPGDSIILHLRRGAQELALPTEVGKRGG